MNMVQRKVSNRLGVKAIIGLDKPNNRDVKASKGTDHLVKRKMTPKNSRSFKRSDSDCLSSPSLTTTELPNHPEKPPPKTPSPQKSPNYMKSTSSSQAKRDQTAQTTVNTPLVNKPAFPGTQKKLSPLSRTSSLQKVRTLTKAPTFKPPRASSSPATKCSKLVFFSAPDVKRSTCSSTLKDSKFPPYLDLHPGATESQGTSVMKVCPYTYCSLNGHHHRPSPPLKCFLASRRRMVKTQKNMKPKVLVSTQNPNASSVNTVKVHSKVVPIHDDRPELLSKDEGDQFFIEIYAKQKEEVALKADGFKRDDSDQETGENNIRASASEASCLSDENPNSMTDSEHNIVKEKDTASSLHLDSTDNFKEPDPNEGLVWDSSTSITLEETFAESSDMEWEEEILFLAGLHENDSLTSMSDQEYDQAFGDPTRYEIFFLEEEQGFKADIEFLEEFCKDEPLGHPAHDEIREQCSDFDSPSYDANTEIDKPPHDWVSQVPPDDDDETNDISQFDNQSSVTGSAEENSAIDSKNTHEGDQEERHVSVEDLNDEAANPEYLHTRRDTPTVNEMEETKQDDDIDDSGSLIDTESSRLIRNFNNDIFNAERSSKKRRSDVLEEQNNSTLKKLCSVDNTDEARKPIETENVIDSVAEGGCSDPENETSIGLTKTLNKKGDADQGIPNICNASRINIIRGKQRAKEESSELIEFNPRGPNFLPLEAAVDTEKVDLRHQEMDERKNTEEWMTDFALRRAVDQLAPARKKKVALLVEAFEKVTPAHKYETYMSSIQQVSNNSRFFQACK